MVFLLETLGTLNMSLNVFLTVKGGSKWFGNDLINFLCTVICKPYREFVNNRRLQLLIDAL